MKHNLYEVVRYGSDLTSEGADGPDTCFLVRAKSPEEAAEIADLQLMHLPHEHVRPYAEIVYLMGTESVDAKESCILRGPYYQDAYCSGWPSWQREDSDAPWVQVDHQDS